MFIDKCTEEEKLAFHKVLTCLALDAFKEHNTDNFDVESEEYMFLDNGAEAIYKFKYRVQILDIIKELKEGDAE